jgi:hypothetical protein
VRTFRTLILASLALGLTSSFACKPKPPEGTTPPDDATADADTGKKGRKGKKGKKGDDGGGDDGGAAESEDPTQKVCPAENGDVPTTVFLESTLVKLPKGVEAMVEQTPFFATMNPSQVESVSCVEGLPGAMISFGAMGYFEDDQKKDIKQSAAETIKSIYGDTLDVKMSEESSGGGGDRRSFQAVMDIPPDPQNGKPDPARGLIALKSAYGRMYWMIWETHPNAWNALKESFKKAAGDDWLFLEVDM